jgi:hypothetical protein
MKTELLGEVITWQLCSKEVKHTDVRQALIAAGLDPDVSKDLTKQSAFTRAIRNMKEERSIDQVKQKADSVVFQLTSKELVGTQYEFQYECQVILDLATGVITSESSHVEQVARDMFNHAMDHRSTSDITRLVQRMFEAAADLFPLRKAGSVYFCPVQHREFTEKVEKFLVRLGGSMGRFPVPAGTVQGDKSVKEAVSSGLQQMFMELDASVADWSDETRDSTFERGVEKWKALKFKVECYAEFLGDAQRKALDQIEASRTLLFEKIDGRNAAAS